MDYATGDACSCLVPYDSPIPLGHPTNAEGDSRGAGKKVSHSGRDVTPFETLAAQNPGDPAT